jgi:pimeloyl-ACP methyl ester carboxylesterase
MPYLLRGGIRFHYQDIGAGPALVLSHAIARDIAQVQRYVGTPPGFRIVCWDARAHGLTQPIGPPERLNFPSFADDLAALLDHLGIENAVLGGISMGAATSVAFCRRWPSRVRALILIRPAWLAEPHPKSLQILELVGRLLSQAPLAQARERFIETEFYRSLETVSARAAEQILSEFDNPAAAERALQFAQITASAPIDDWQQLQVCNMPGLVVRCANDPFHPLEVGGTWVEHLPDARMATVVSPFENPDEHIRQLRDAIGEFLNTL